MSLWGIFMIYLTRILKNMMSELDIFCFSVLAFVLYNAFVLNKFGVPESVSSTSYLFKTYNGKPWLFSFMCVIIVVGLFPLWVNVSDDNYDCLVFITCAGILFAGATPMFRESFERPIHYGSGIILTISFILWFVFNSYWITLVSIGILSLLLILLKPMNYVYFFEVVAYLTLSTHLISGCNG